MDNLTGAVRRCIEDYRMIEAGDVIAVGLSGGKDSVTLLAALAALRRYYPKPFTLRAVTLSMGFDGMDFAPLTAWCASLGVEHTVLDTRLADVIFAERQEPNPCALCSKMRRGALNDAVRALGGAKLALGHNRDDVIETFLMSLLYEGRLYCFQPVTYMSRAQVTQIRPMLYVPESASRAFAARNGLPVVKNLCPMDGVSKRQEAKDLLADLARTRPDIQTKIFNAIQRLPLPGWGLSQEENAR